MNTDVKLSTKFMTTQNAHQIGMLVSVGGEQPVERPPINVALVLDRSGSMGGEHLTAAKDAAIRFVRFLSPADRLSVVTFDDVVTTIFGPAPGGDSAAEDAIRAVERGGRTNLSGGWLKGREHVQGGLVTGTNRVVLFTDGCANDGITDVGKLTGLSRGAASDGVTTTCIGFGPHFNEDLLQPMAQAGGANYWYIETHDQMGDIFEEEIEGLVALAAQNLEISVHLTDPRVAGVTMLQSYPVRRTDGGAFVTTLGDLYATSPRQLGLIFHVEQLDTLGEVELGEVKVTSDMLVADGIEHRVVTMPVTANLDGEDHLEPTVESTLTRFEAARAREEAVNRADAGDFDGASAVLLEACAKLSALPPTPTLAEEVVDLEAEAERLKEREYRAEDRKYHKARSMAAREGRPRYLDKIRRRKPR